MKNKIIYPALVIKEAKSLRKLLTNEEKGRLLLDIFPDNKEKCIYGRISGNCENERATSLIEKCCSRVFHIPEDANDRLENCKINGSPKEKPRHTYFSPIEVFIYRQRKNPKVIRRLADYIAGKKRTL